MCASTDADVNDDQSRRDATERQRVLIEANERLRAASEAKSRFLAHLSHELRTPLNAILGYVQLLKARGGLDAKQQAGLGTIEQSGQHLLSLVDDILDLARVEADKLALAPVPVDLPALLAMVGDVVREQAERKALRFVCEAAPDLPCSVRTDARRLRQILLNLLGNAVKFTDHGEVRLRAHAQRCGGQARVRFEVADTGIGIAPGDCERLFRPFEQLGTAAYRAGGAGLGLSISQALARLMGSEIRVHSHAQRGSCFSFELSLQVLDAPTSGEGAGAPCRPARVQS